MRWHSRPWSKPPSTPDPNLGRILSAIGYAGITDLDVNGIKLWLGDVLVASNGERHPDYLEATANAS